MMFIIVCVCLRSFCMYSPSSLAYGLCLSVVSLILSSISLFFCV